MYFINYLLLFITDYSNIIFIYLQYNLQRLVLLFTFLAFGFDQTSNLRNEVSTSLQVPNGKTSIRPLLR